MNKNQLRKSSLERRAAMTLEESQAMSKSIGLIFFDFLEKHLTKVKWVHVFLPIAGKGEINTFPIFYKLSEAYPQVSIALSKSNFSDCSMQLFKYDEKTALVENAFGIPEPNGGEMVHPAQLDLVLIPMLLADKFGNRLGYGKGFYDRFLQNCRPECYKIGLSFEEPMDEIPSEKHDIRLDFCITPANIHKLEPNY